MMARGGLGVVILLASLSSLHGMRGPPAAAARQRAVRMMADAAPRRANAIPIIEEIVELAGNDYVNKAVRMLQSMDKQRAQLQGIPRKEAGRAYAAVWDASARTSRYAITLNIYQRLLAEPGLLELDDAKVDTVLLACERQADGVLAEQIMRQVGESAKRYNRVIRARTKQLEITDAVRLYRELQQRKWKLETSTINLMMQVCFAIKQVDYSLKLFQAMDALGLEADERTFTIAIRSAAASKVAKGPRTATDIGSGWVLSLRLLNAMRAKEQAQGMPRIKQAPLVPSAYCFSTVIRTLAFAGEADKAVSVLGQMVKAERSPDAGLYAVVMKACGLRGRIDEASALLDEMVAAGLSADVAHVAALMLGCERRGDSRRALAILDKLPSLGLKPTTLTYNMAMASCAKRGEIKEAEGLLAQMDAAGEEGRPDIVSLNTMLDTYKRADQWEACLEFLLKMEKERLVQPDVVSVNTAIKACKDNGQTELALQLFDGMSARGLAPDSVSYTEILAACGKAGDWARALAVFGAAKTSAGALNTFTWNAIVGAAVACDQSEEALRLIKEMRASGIAPDIVTFTTVMTMCSRKEEWQAVLFLAAELEATGLELSKPLISQVQKASQVLSGKERREASV